MGKKCCNYEPYEDGAGGKSTRYPAFQDGSGRSGKGGGTVKAGKESTGSETITRASGNSRSAKKDFTEE